VRGGFTFHRGRLVGGRLAIRRSSMIAPAKPQRPPQWHAAFLAMLPTMAAGLSFARSRAYRRSCNCLLEIQRRSNPKVVLPHCPGKNNSRKRPKTAVSTRRRLARPFARSRRFECQKSTEPPSSRYRRTWGLDLFSNGFVAPKTVTRRANGRLRGIRCADQAVCAARRQTTAPRINY
jgi:hypothetical protein